jgi:regulatory protein RepA
MNPIEALIEDVNIETETGTQAAEPVKPYDLSQCSVSRFKGEPEETKFLVSGLIPQGIAGTLYSAGGSGKSTLALDLSLRVAIANDNPTKWLGKYDVPEGGRVLYFSAEEPEAVLHKRIRGLAESLASEIAKDLDTVLSTAGENLYLKNLWGSTKQLFNVKSNSITATEEYNRIYETIKKYQPRLVIFDTRSRLSGAEGAGNAIVSQEVAFYEKLSADFGCTVLVLHHTSKQSYDGNTSAQAAQRGESAFTDCLRFGMYLQILTEEQAKANGIAESERWKYLVVTHSKANYTTIKEPIILLRDGWHFELTDLKPKTTREERKVKDESEDIEKVIRAVKDTPAIIQSELTKVLRETGLSFHRAREAVKNAVEIGAVNEAEGKQGRKTYSISETSKKP